MINLLQSGVEWLADVMSKKASTPVKYVSGNVEFDVPAVMTNTRYELSDEYGSVIGSFRVDFLIEAASLAVTPASGDVIRCPDLTGGYTVVYEVMEIAGEGCWRWSDPHGSVRRIHAKRISE